VTTLLAVAAGSLLIGFLVGVVLEDAYGLYRIARKDRPMPKPSGRQILGGVLVVAVVLQLLVGVLLIDARRDLSQSNREVDEYVSCTTGWQQDFAAAYRARIAVAEDTAAAMEEVVRSVAADNPERFDAAVADYIAVRDEQITEQRRRPYPPLPDELCGPMPEESR
jgi:hypothetical protein